MVHVVEIADREGSEEAAHNQLPLLHLHILCLLASSLFFVVFDFSIIIILMKQVLKLAAVNFVVWVLALQG